MNLINIIKGISITSSGIPGMPRLTAILKKDGELEVIKKERGERDYSFEQRYDIRLNGKDIGTYVVRKKGNLFGETLVPNSTIVERSLLTTHNDGTIFQRNEAENCYRDLGRIFKEYEEVGSETLN
jgi:hypothetical protein